MRVSGGGRAIDGRETVEGGLARVFGVGAGAFEDEVRGSSAMWVLSSQKHGDRAAQPPTAYLLPTARCPPIHY